jgi:hypothetical protein
MITAIGLAFKFLFSGLVSVFQWIVKVVVERPWIILVVIPCGVAYHYHHRLDNVQKQFDALSTKYETERQAKEKAVSDFQALSFAHGNLAAEALRNATASAQTTLDAYRKQRESDAARIAALDALGKTGKLTDEQRKELDTLRTSLAACRLNPRNVNLLNQLGETYK